MFPGKASLLTLAIASIGLTGCFESSRETTKNSNPDFLITNPGLERGTHPLFDPLETEFVIPSDSLFNLSEVDDGTMLNGTDPANPVTTGIGFLDGASVLAPIDIKISGSVGSVPQVLDARDFVSIDGEVVPNPKQNVFFFPVEYASGDSLRQVDGAVAGISPAIRYRRALDQQDTDALNSLLEEKVRVELLDIDGGEKNLIRITPLEPLSAKTRYAVALTNGIVDAQGNPLVGSPTYQSVADPERTLANAAFEPFRNALLPARRLAADYFDFKREYEASASFSAGFDDVVQSTFVTTTAIEDVLLANASPITFFLSTLNTQARQDGLSLLISGFYNLTQRPLDGEATTEQQSVNDEIFNILTDETFQFFNADLADLLTNARQDGLTFRYSDVVTDSLADRRLAYAIQTATAKAVDDITDQKTEAQALADAATVAPEGEEPLVDIPKPREVRVFSQRDGSTVNPALGQTAQLALGAETQLDIHVYEGEITLPYFQSIPADEADGATIQSSNWTAADFSGSESLSAAPSERITYRFPFAAKTGETKVPLVIAAPDTNQQAGLISTPADGFPVIIYQHAATTDRSAILTLATAAGLSCADPGTDFDCFVTIGIDQPLHGIFDTGAEEPKEDGIVGLRPISEQPDASEDATERHFGFAADADMNAVPASQLMEPGSGDLFLNFANYANTRDNIRQGTLDLLNVNASLDNIEAAINACVDCPQGLAINTDRVYFLSHSLSGMGGAAVPPVTNAAAVDNTNLTPFIAQNILNTGGQFSRLLENSQSLAPRLLPGLEEASDGLLSQGRTELNIYFNVFQGLLDGTDPTAYASFYAGSDTLLTSIVGLDGDPDRPTDNTVPNAADDLLYDLGPLMTTVPETGFVIDSERAPLAGTDPVAAIMGAESTPLPSGLPSITRYLEGSHGNPISAGQKGSDPFSSSAVFEEMFTQMLQLFTSANGIDPGSVSVTNRCVVQDAGADPNAAECDGQTDASENPSGNETDPDGGDPDGGGGLIGVGPL